MSLSLLTGKPPDLQYFLSSCISCRACVFLIFSSSSFIFNHQALEKTNTFLDEFPLMTGDCVLSTTIAPSWSDIPGTTVVVLTRVGRLVMWRSKTQSPLVGSLWVWVRWNSRSMSMKWLHAEMFCAPVLTSSCSQFMSPKLKSPQAWYWCYVYFLQSHGVRPVMHEGLPSASSRHH